MAKRKSNLNDDELRRLADARREERQKLIKHIQALIVDEYRQTHEMTRPKLRMVAALLAYVVMGEGTSVGTFDTTPEIELFTSKILPDIRDFAKDEREVLSIVTELFGWYSNSLVNELMA